MSKEYSNQKVRENNLEVAGRVKLKPEDVDRLCREHEAWKYVPVKVFNVLLAKAETLLLSSVERKSTCFTCGIDTSMVKQVLCVLLRVPAQGADTTKDSDLKLQTDEEVKAFEQARKDACRIGQKLAKPTGPVLTYEDYADLISTATDSKFAEQLLLSAKAGDAPIQTPSGRLLPVIVPPPKTLIAKEAIPVRLKVLCVDEEEHLASVQILKEGGSGCPALAGLVGKTLPLEFSAKKAAVRNLLIGMQLVNKSIYCKVTMARALRSVDRKLTMLRFVKCLPDGNQQKEVRDQLAQLEFDFGTEETAVPSAPIDHQDVAAPTLQ